MFPLLGPMPRSDWRATGINVSREDGPPELLAFREVRSRNALPGADRLLGEGNLWRKYERA